MTVRRRKTMPVQKPLPTTLQYPELTSPVYKNWAKQTKKAVKGRKRSFTGNFSKEEGWGGGAPVLRVAGLPLCEVLLHRVARHVPREHLYNI